MIYTKGLYTHSEPKALTGYMAFTQFGRNILAVNLHAGIGNFSTGAYECWFLYNHPIIKQTCMENRSKKGRDVQSYSGGQEWTKCGILEKDRTPKRTAARTSVCSLLSTLNL